MDYSLLLAVHNITEEMKSTQQISVVSSSREVTPISSDTIHEDLTTTSTDSGIAMTTISNLPTYIQYLRVIEFIRAQQESSVINIETASIKTVIPELSPRPNQDIYQSSTSLPFHLANGLIGGDVWYNRQNLSRLAMYVIKRDISV